MTDVKANWPTAEQIQHCVRHTFPEKIARALSFERWKDGIEIEHPTSETTSFARQLFAMGVVAGGIYWRSVPKNLYELVGIGTPLLVSWFVENGPMRVTYVSYARDGLAALSYRNLYAIADAPEPAPINSPTNR